MPSPRARRVGKKAGKEKRAAGSGGAASSSPVSGGPGSSPEGLVRLAALGVGSLLLLLAFVGVVRAVTQAPPPPPPPSLAELQAAEQARVDEETGEATAALAAVMVNNDTAALEGLEAWKTTHFLVTRSQLRERRAARIAAWAQHADDAAVEAAEAADKAKAEEEKKAAGGDDSEEKEEGEAAEEAPLSDEAKARKKRVQSVAVVMPELAIDGDEAWALPPEQPDDGDEVNGGDGDDVPADGAAAAVAAEEAEEEEEEKVFDTRGIAEALREVGFAGRVAPIHTASARGYTQAVQWLLDHGADPRVRGGNSRGCLSWASSEGHAATVALLVKPKAEGGGGLDPNAYDGEGDDYMTPLHRAARHGRAPVVAVLLATGAKWDARDHLGRTAIHLAASRGHTETLVVLTRHPGVDVDDTTPDGYTPLHMAAMGNHDRVVALLLDDEDSLVRIDEREELEYEMKLEKSDKGELYYEDDEVVEKLQREAQEKPQNFTKAQWKKHLEAEARYREEQQHTFEMEQARAMENGLAANAAEEAAQEAGRPVPKAQLDAKTSLEQTPLYMSAIEGNVEVAEVLIANGADVNAQISHQVHGERIMHAAAAAGHLEFVKLLIKHGADAAPLTDDGLTPRHFAEEGNHEEVADYLEWRAERQASAAQAARDAGAN